MKKIIFVFLILSLMLTACSDESGGKSEVFDESDQYFATESLAGSHILVAYQGAEAASVEVTRTKVQARSKVDSLLQILQDDPSQFENFARNESDGKAAANGGDLGVWRKGQRIEAFDNAIDAMRVDSLGNRAVKTSFGFHIIRREQAKEKYLAWQGLVIGYQGVGVPAQITRSMSDAQIIADSIMALNPTIEDLKEIAAKHDDLFEGKMPLRAITRYNSQGRFVYGVLDTMRYNQIAGPILLPIGYAILTRIKLEQRAGAHILIYHNGVEGMESLERTKDEAIAIAENLLKQALENPDDFSELARQYSDGNTASRGGNLGVWFKGEMVPEIDTAIGQTGFDEVHAEIVASQFGIHILKRYPTN